ncbi:DUF5671 domain-containing protein [Glaciibacter psychrotolerans]|uniref:DUF5671 domain-containing protein n=1 Tax=Glaciibacter psychrotolerans TaxID=670054 RepID=A0A7Z0EFB5_9MICO|nr:DUF5671 domain-containing protein [Leifsonia psychrotolerans]NYJ20200.1 hypothetical protein [Leifsonia psychrotolerans]
MTISAPIHAPVRPAAQGVVRRLIVFILLFTLVVIVAIGLSGLLGRLLDTSVTLAGSDVTGLAQSLAFTFIAGPLAALLGWFVWRSLRDERERATISWGLYLAAISSVAVITFSLSLLSAASDLLAGEWRPSAAATAIVWAGVWCLHRVIWRRPQTAPLRLAALVPLIGAWFGMGLLVGGGIGALGTLFHAAVDRFTDPVSIGSSWWLFAAQSALWSLGGGILWWTQWIHDRARDRPSAFASVLLIVLGIGGGALTCLFGLGTTVYVVLDVAFDRSQPLAAVLDPLPTALAAGLIGAVVWRYHHVVVTQRSVAVRLSERLVLSGIGLAGAASGVGILVNSLLAASVPTFAGNDLRPLLLAGLSSLLVAAPLWWMAWKPAAVVHATAARSMGRRVYLIAIFGVSAVVALITLLVIAYRLFAFTLEAHAELNLVDHVRAPLGLLFATALTAGYHFRVWRNDRAAFPPLIPVEPMIRHVVLVTGADPEPLSQAISAVSGAQVTVWPRAEADEFGPTVESVVSALSGVSGERMLLLAGPGSRIEVIALVGDTGAATVR